MLLPEPLAQDLAGHPEHLMIVGAWVSRAIGVAAWLDPRQRDPAELPPLRPWPVESMERRALTRRVNSVKIDDPGRTAAVELPAPPRQPTLFDAA